MNDLVDDIEVSQPPPRAIASNAACKSVVRRAMKCFDQQ
jgi:hypothetical protein